METGTSRTDAPPGSEPAFALTVENDPQQGAFPGRRKVRAMVHAEAQVPAGDSGRRLPPGDIGVLIAVDFAPDRIAATRDAVAAAIDRLPDGVRFALLEERRDENGVLRQPEWRVADDHRRSQARADAEWMRVLPPKDSTSYARWLAQARKRFCSGDAPRLRHLLVITDGSGRTSRLEEELDACTGEFTCDVLGVGEDWQLDPLTRIAEALHGTAGCVRDSQDVTDWLTSTMDRLLRTRLPMAALEVILRPGVELQEITQLSEQRRPLEPLSPPEGDTPAPAHPPGRARRLSFATRVWTMDDARDFELVLLADPTGDPLDEDIQLAAVTLGSASVPVLVRWSYEPGSARGRGALPGQRTKVVRAYIDGCQALDEGTWSVAERQLGTAVRLAQEPRDADILQRIRDVADVVDAAAGKVRLRRRLDRLTLKEIRLYSHRVPPVRHASRGGGEDGRGAGGGHEDGGGRADGGGTSAPYDSGLVGCSVPHCRQDSVRGARYCVRCGAPL